MAAIAEVADEQILEQERPEVADVSRAVDGGTAAVDADVSGFEGLEFTDGSGHGVVKPDRHEPLPGRPPGRATRRRWPRSISLRLRTAQVARGGFDVDGRGFYPEGRRDGLLHRRQELRQPGPGGDDRQIHVCRAHPPLRLLFEIALSRTPLSAPAGVRWSAGKTRPRSPSPAAPSSASATACSATSPSE